MFSDLLMLPSPLNYDQTQIPDIPFKEEPLTEEAHSLTKTKAIKDQVFFPKVENSSEKFTNLNSLLKQTTRLEERVLLLQNRIKNSSYSECDENDLRTTLQALKDLQANIAHKTSKKNKRIKASIHSSIKEIDKKIGQYSLRSLIAKKKGEKVRHRTITARFIHSLLSQDLKGINTFTLMSASRAIARQILEIMEDPNRYKGKSLQLKANEKDYSFYSFTWNTDINLTIPYSFWLELSEDAKKIKLFIVTEKLNDGAYKKVSILHHFTIDLELNLRDGEIASEYKEAPSDRPINHVLTIGRRQYLRNYEYFPKVLHEAQDKESVDAINHGIKIHKKIHELCPEAFTTSLAINPKNPVLGTNSFSKYPLQYQDWCNGDLLSLQKTHDTVLLNLKSTSRRLQLDFEDIFDIFIDIGESLMHLHKHKIVHKDIKPNNIFLKTTGLENKKVKGLLADFDLSQIAGLGRSLSDLPYYSYLAGQGITVPFADVYGLAMCLINSFLTNSGFSNLHKFLDENQRAVILWNVIKKSYQEKFENTSLTTYNYKSPNAKLVSDFLKDLKIIIKNCSHVQKKDLQKAYGEIVVLSEIISLIAKVVFVERKIKSNVQFTREENVPWSFIRFETSEILFIDNNEQKLAAVEFLKQMDKLERKEKEIHPLYIALKNPMELEDCNECLKNEIALMDLPTVIKERSKRILQKTNDIAEIVRKHKWLFLESTQDKKISKDERIDYNNVSNQINNLEKATAYCAKLKNYYQKTLALIEEQTMPIDLFVAHLKEIKQKYNLIINGDDEKI